MKAKEYLAHIDDMLAFAEKHNRTMRECMTEAIRRFLKWKGRFKTSEWLTPKVKPKGRGGGSKRRR